MCDTENIDRLLDRLQDESVVSGGLYVALITLWTLTVREKMELDESMMHIVAEAINQYEKMHIP